MSKLFNAVQEGHDSLNRIVFLCQDSNGVYVYKPANGFKSKHFWFPEEEEEANACFERQVSCGHVHAFYEEGEHQEEGEEYPTPDEDEAAGIKTLVKKVVKKKVVKKPAKKK